MSQPLQGTLPWQWLWQWLWQGQAVLQSRELQGPCQMGQRMSLAGVPAVMQTPLLMC